MGGLNRKNVAASPNYEAIDGSLERYDPVEAIGAIIQCLGGHHDRCYLLGGQIRENRLTRDQK